VLCRLIAWRQHDDGTWLCDLRWGVSGRLYQARYVYDPARVRQSKWPLSNRPLIWTANGRRTGETMAAGSGLAGRAPTLSLLLAGGEGRWPWLRRRVA
jgi:hypothetical protein